MKHFGLIGFPLSHSFSPSYFSEKFKSLSIDAEYRAYPIGDISLFRETINKNHLSGVNVTIPYKEQVISFLDDIDPTAAIIGAVNTIVVKDGHTTGYNTDVFGFEVSLLDLIKNRDNISRALILGTGGAAKAVEFVLNKLGIPFDYISRGYVKGFAYENIPQHVFRCANLIINTTPLGMYPMIDTKPNIPYHWIDKNYFLYDLVYNPEKTLFLTEGSIRNAIVKNGHDMLVLQAEEAWKIWNQS